MFPPLFLTQKYTFWSLDARRICRLSDEEGEEMNKSVEQFFVKTYIDKDYQERLLFELNSIKKRSKALSRFLMTLNLF